MVCISAGMSVCVIVSGKRVRMVACVVCVEGQGRHSGRAAGAGGGSAAAGAGGLSCGVGRGCAEGAACVGR